MTSLSHLSGDQTRTISVFKNQYLKWLFINFNFNRKHLNIPQEEHDALKRLSKNKDIIITIPDKGSGVVINESLLCYLHK